MSKQIKIALLMAASLFMEIMDGTIVITALPQMAKDFQTSIAQMSLLVSVYLVTVAIFLPLSGWIANYFGKKRIWLFAVLLFTVSSLGSALAKDFTFLLTMRIIQGVSGALMTPTARLIVLEKTPARDLLKMTSYFVWPALLAPAIAPVIGGAIVTYFTWHWIFLINIPIGIVIVMMGISMIPKDVEFIRNKFDWIGFIEIAIASVLLVVGAEFATHSSVSLVTAGLIFIAVGLLLGAVIYNHLNKAKQPLFSLKALKITSFRISQSSGAVLWLSVGAMPYLLTLFLQNRFHWSAVVAGTYVLFIFLGNIAIKPFTTPIIRTLKYKGAFVCCVWSGFT
ncbi:MFS transporter [Listeria grayi]|uniref:MFS transporter n=1 Tax=Listeria grayi TaxID=1641 RepID=UPI0004B6F74E|nr:MFS transporter [Listeria grayi]